MNKKGIGIIMILGFFVILIIGIYLVLLIPIPAFTKIRTTINYFLMLLLWIVLQVGLISGYYKLIRFGIVFILSLKTKFSKWTFGVQRYIITHSHKN